jgi:hypothetical protein
MVESPKLYQRACGEVANSEATSTRFNLNVPYSWAPPNYVRGRPAFATAVAYSCTGTNLGKAGRAGGQYNRSWEYTPTAEEYMVLTIEPYELWDLAAIQCTMVVSAVESTFRSGVNPPATEYASTAKDRPHAESERRLSLRRLFRQTKLMIKRRKAKLQLVRNRANKEKGTPSAASIEDSVLFTGVFDTIFSTPDMLMLEIAKFCAQNFGPLLPLRPLLPRPPICAMVSYPQIARPLR